MANNFEINLPANAFVLPSSGYPNRAVVQNRPYLAFDDAAVENAISEPFRMPASYTGIGTLKADIFYIAASATSGKFDFDVSVEAVTPADAVDLDAGESFDTANAADGTVPSTAGYLGLITVTLATKDSVAAGDLVRIKIERDADDATNDTATGDACVLLVAVREEV